MDYLISAISAYVEHNNPISEKNLHASNIANRRYLYQVYMKKCL